MGERGWLARRDILHSKRAPLARDCRHVEHPTSRRSRKGYGSATTAEQFRDHVSQVFIAAPKVMTPGQSGRPTTPLTPTLLQSSIFGKLSTKLEHGHNTNALSPLASFVPVRIRLRTRSGIISPRSPPRKNPQPFRVPNMSSMLGSCLNSDRSK